MVCANIGVSILSVIVIIAAFMSNAAVWAQWTIVIAALLTLIASWTSLDCRYCKAQPVAKSVKSSKRK
jgi:hypothetical protein